MTRLPAPRSPASSRASSRGWRRARRAERAAAPTRCGPRSATRSPRTSSCCRAPATATAPGSTTRSPATRAATSSTAGAGTDTLSGLGGADTFAFSTALGSTNVDRIVDFSSEDMIRLSKGVFAARDRGTLDVDAFKDLGVQGATVDGDGRILYDAKGRLFYDADGAGGDEAVLFARVSYRPTLTHDDGLVV